MGAFVRDAHFVRSPALAPARLRYPRQSHPTHRCGRLTIRCASPHPPLRVWSPSATPRCVPTAPRCVLSFLCLPGSRTSWKRLRSTGRRSSTCQRRRGCWLQRTPTSMRRRPAGMPPTAHRHPPALAAPREPRASKARPRGSGRRRCFFIYTKSAWFVRGTPILGADTHFEPMRPPAPPRPSGRGEGQELVRIRSGCRTAPANPRRNPGDNLTFTRPGDGSHLLRLASPSLPLSPSPSCVPHPPARSLARGSWSPSPIQPPTLSTLRSIHPSPPPLVHRPMERRRCSRRCGRDTGRWRGCWLRPGATIRRSTAA